jgi:TolA-binding protein
MMNRIAAFLLVLACALPLCADGKVNWYSSFDKALADAKKNSKPIFVDVYTDWCTWCHKLDADVYSTPQFAEAMQNYIPVKLNAEDEKEGTRFAEKYQVDGFPMLIVTDSGGAVTNRIGGYMEADALIKDIDQIQGLLLQEKNKPDDIQSTFELAREYLNRDMYTGAEVRFEQVIASPRATPTQKEESQFSLALTEYYQRKLQQALGTVEVYKKNYPNQKSGEDVLLLLSQLQIEMNANDKATATLKEFLRKYPKSENVSRAQQVLDLLQKDMN